MIQFVDVRKSTYFDSVTLMLISGKLAELPQIVEAAVMMGTEHNKRLMLRSGVLDEGNAAKVKPNDLVIGILAETQDALDAARQQLDVLMREKDSEDEALTVPIPDLDAACDKLGTANFSVISLPGAYAGREAQKAMARGLHVLLFSDNVDLETENRLKDYALAHGLLMMGPDCGTAIVNGVALGFANRVRRGRIGLVAAAGTGLQEVTTLIHRMGGGISQALGTGGRDGKDAVGGKMLLQCLRALAQDPQTEVIGIISKPLGEKTLSLLQAELQTLRKPIVTCFLGAPKKDVGHYSATLAQAARTLCALGGYPDVLAAQPLPAAPTFAPKQAYLRGLYSGGTLCYETLLLLKSQGIDCHSNLSATSAFSLADPEQSRAHTLVDMGDDYFTNGMPHPMIDPRLRTARIVREACDPETAVILLDCVLGYGSHPDPAAALADAVRRARAARRAEGEVVFVASVCGTEEDIQCRSRQEATLRDSGVVVAESNAAAALYAAELLKGACGK